MAKEERGSTIPFVALLMCVVFATMYLFAVVGSSVCERTSAQTAADSSALAGVTGGLSGATKAAALNGGRLLWLKTQGSDVVASVEVGHSIATAQARAAAQSDTNAE